MNTETNYAELFYTRYINNNDSLEKLLADYPVSALSHFLLSYHLKKNTNSDFEKSIKKTALYFNNTNWLQFQLTSTDSDNNEKTSNFVESKIEPANVSMPEDNNEIKNVVAELSGLDETLSKNTDAIKDQIVISSSENEKTENLQPGNELELMTSFGEARIASEPKEELLETAQQHNTAPMETTTEEPLAFEPKEEIAEGIFQNDNISVNVPDEEFLNSKPKEENLPLKPSAEDVRIQSLPNNEEELLAFEPLHTVDYFASQGIKIKEEVLLNDKLGNQVKSFTAWLKSMKQLHPGKLPEQNEVIEKIIQSSAEESNTDAHILTEAMAEVLIKQDKTEKAVEMYHKLSLMNPSKSAYFAAKIESIKTHQ
ncbi:MAG: hypothetical protein Q8891_13325 [Bacteroidota bacterium]|nr:hypothetical protein [Bacteroidota bacterium]